MLRGTRNNELALAERSARNTQAYRLARLEQKVNVLTPEKKYYTPIVTHTIPNLSFNFLEITNVVNGTEDTQRLGDKIRAHHVKVTASTQTDEKFDLYLIRPRDAGRDPLLADFAALRGGWYNPQYGWVLKHWMVGGSDADSFYGVNDVYGFKKPMLVEFGRNAGATPAKNRLVLVVVNRSGAAITVQYAAQLCYTDI